MKIKLGETNKTIASVLAFAKAAHGTQKRKYTGEDYIVHPMRVLRLYVTMSPGKIVRAASCAACLLHDVVEDTDVTEAQLRDVFSAWPEVPDLVMELTDKSKPSDGNRAVRKKIDRENLWNASREAQIIKSCDMIENSISIIEHDPSFAKTYMKEKEALLAGFTKAYTSASWYLAQQIVEWYKEDPTKVVSRWASHEKAIFGSDRKNGR